MKSEKVIAGLLFHHPAAHVKEVGPLMAEACHTEGFSFDNYFKLTSTIAVIIFSFLTANLRNTIANTMKIDLPDEVIIRQSLLNIIKNGITN